jgi:hypothetical protein
MNARHRIGLATPIALALWALPAYAQNAQQAGGQSDQEPGRTGHAVNDESGGRSGSTRRMRLTRTSRSFQRRAQNDASANFFNERQFAALGFELERDPTRERVLICTRGVRA